MLADSIAIAAEYVNREKARADLQSALKETLKQLADNKKERDQLYKSLIQKQKEKDFYEYEARLQHILDELHEIEEREEEIRSRLSTLNEKISRFQKKTGFERSLGLSGLPSLEAIKTDEVLAIEKEIRNIKADIAAQEMRYHTEHHSIRELKAKLHRLEAELSAATERAASVAISEAINEKHLLNVELEQLQGKKSRKREELDKFHAFGAEFLPEREAHEDLRQEYLLLLESKRTLESLIALESGYFEVHSPATDPVRRPKATHRATLFVAVAALIAAIAVAYLVEYLDTTIITDHDVRRHLNLPVIAIMPEIKDTTSIMVTPIVSPLVELYSTTAALLVKLLEEKSQRALLISSCLSGEGKTTVAINLSASLARQNYRVILVDSDLRNPSIHRLMGLDNSYGLSNLIEKKGGDLPANSSSQRFDEENDIRLLRTTLENLLVLPCGPKPYDPLALIRSQAFRSIIEQLKSQSDFVIMDSAPLCTASDPVLLSTIADAAILVVGSGMVDQSHASWAKHLLINVQANILGVILNRSKLGRPTEYYYYYSSRQRERV